jgi:hypothetical protein
MTTDAEIRNQIAQRNSIRADGKLPALDARELKKLIAARDQKIFEAAFAAERHRFSESWRKSTSWAAGYGLYSKARKQVREELRMGLHLDVVLRELGYRLVEDAWDTHGRKTYLHDDDADRQFLKDLQATLAQYSWVKDKRRLRCFRCEASGEFIEIEPGGSEVSGSFLHYLKSE